VNAFAQRKTLTFLSVVLGMALLAGCSTPERLLVLGLFSLGYSAEAGPPLPPVPATAPADSPADTTDAAAAHSTTSPGAGGTATAAPPAALPENVLAAYRRSGCFEGADDFLVVFRDGRLTLTERTGEKFAGTATEAELSRLADQLASPGLAGMDDYFPAMGADLCVYEVTAWVAGVPRLMTTMDGADTPSALQELIDPLEVLRQRAAGTGGAVPPVIEVGGAGTLHVLSAYDPLAAEDAAFSEMVIAFEIETDIAVELETVDPDWGYEKLVTYLAAGMPVDVALIPAARVGELQESGFLAVLPDALADADANAGTGDSTPCLANGERICSAGPDGLVWVIPASAQEPEAAVTFLEYARDSSPG
jgi:hypothetical protein